MEAGLARPAVSLSPALRPDFQVPHTVLQGWMRPSGSAGRSGEHPRSGHRCWPRALGLVPPHQGPAGLKCAAEAQTFIALPFRGTFNCSWKETRPTTAIVDSILVRRLCLTKKPFISSLFHIFSSLKKTFYSGPNF